MKWLPLLWAALRRKPGRSIFTLLSIMVAFFLVGSMAGLNASFAKHIEDARGDRVVVIGRFVPWIPVSYVEQIAELSGVTNIAYTGNIQATHPNSVNSVFVIMTDARFGEVQPELNIAPDLFSKLESTQDGVIVSRAMADRLAWHIGERVPLETDRIYQDGTQTWTFRIVAIVPDNQRYPTGFALGNFSYLNEGRADDGKGQISNIHLLVDDPERAGEISKTIEALFVNSPVSLTAVPERTAIEIGLKGLLDVKFFSFAISAAALFMLIFLTASVMAQSVRERLAEFAVMKTLGFSLVAVRGLIIMEASVLCFAGAGFGLVMATWMPAMIELVLPGMIAPIMTPSVAATSFFCAFVVAVISVLLATRRLKRLSIAGALEVR